MKVKTIKDLNAVVPKDWPPNGVIPEGTVLDGAKYGDGIVKFIKRGVADPADEEARLACGMDDAEIAIAKFRQRRTSAGIHPDDYDAYDQGLMVGYNPDGTWKPGPNARTDQPEDEYEEDDEDEFDNEPIEPEEDPQPEEETENE